ncbi:AAEL015161-PA [Aedes aegypti]|uniref:AAEL015161-PA n=1 Tax=Aedes aegypti TaxID=7159 RepID=Q16EH9_AEDAE|nr:AAEL015161-PA [Aedes aegypti]
MNGIGCLYGVLLFLLSQTVVQPARQLHHRRHSRSVETEESEDGQESYVVGVVEFRPEPSDVDVRSRTERHLEAYAELIRSDEAKVSNELIIGYRHNYFSGTHSQHLLGLSLHSEPMHNLILCWEKYTSKELLSFFLASESEKYLVINLSEIFDCKSCAPHGYVWYNTNVVFDRNGAVIARYRKFNLLGEHGTERTYVPEIVTFETDFGVTFGLFTRSDVLFARPALELVKRDVKDLIMPSMWQAELPYLTSTQVYESWAYSNNVNLIVAGGNNEATGSTGTGVFNGRSGAILSFVTGEPTRRLFPVRVPINPGIRTANHIPLEDSDTEAGRLHGKFLEEINIERDFLEQFTTLQINPERYHDHIGQIICNGFFCCEFSVTLTIVPDQDVTHYYRFAVFDGYRSLSKHSDTYISTCGIIACRNQSLSSCGLPMNENSNYLAFNEIVITGKFQANGTLAMANSLDDMLHPLSVDQYTFYSSVNYSTNQQDVQLTLSSGSAANLQTFAIYAINYENFEYFNPIEAPPEPTTESSSIEFGAVEDDTGGSTRATTPGALQLLLILMLLVSSVRELRL